MANPQQFLANIASELGVSNAGMREPEAFPQLFQQKGQGGCPGPTLSMQEKQERISIMQQAAEPLHLHCHHVHSLDEAGVTIATIIENAQPEFSDKKIVIQHDHPDIAGLDLVARLTESQIVIETTTPGKDVFSASASATVGVTAPCCGIADSATVIQQERVGEPLSTSLLPSVHIALLRIKNLVANRDEAYAVLGGYPESSLVFISGPSKTADIEANLVLGAHGPKEMHCVLLDE